MSKLLYAEETYKIRGAAFEVYRQLGPGHAEGVYEEALKISFRKRGIPFRDQVPFEVVYEGIKVGAYRPDLLAYDKVLLELKALENLLPIHEAQVLSYLRVTALRLGLLINFGAADVQIKRRVLTQGSTCGTSPERNKPYMGGLERLPYPELVWAIGNCVKRVHFTLGPGFLFHIYENALAVEMSIQGIGCERVKYLDVKFDGHSIGRDRVHLLVADEKVLVVPVAVNRIESLDLKITRKQLDALGLKLGLVVNFHDVRPRTRVVQVLPTSYR
jgi:GxxExxY protein